ncbi:hypothetical protein FE391_42790 [Nonomuraea sp. KC401]|uniref:Uncharacterized protein n=1 Tax=Nonomuraea longispora TaxID=1848320 RepID=A0A4R4MYA8_9ACTN|nr:MULTISPECIES: hypothetical protein [Nonomuraea]NBE97102.1 hypothetical protein [Nonomuraea sp. K271]TDB99469.1 hypothetical protein E1267_37425 [Nonomuraea longispora]TLF53551.1 hypothetical protein FE391_42790 [Nonomuraea sp. KC401]
MRRLITVLASAAAGTALMIATAGPAFSISIVDCVLGTGVVLPSPTSTTRLACYGGTFHGQPVGGIA